MQAIVSVHDLEIIWGVLLWCCEAIFTKTTKTKTVHDEKVKLLFKNIDELYFKERKADGTVLSDELMRQKQVPLDFERVCFERIYACFEATFLEIGHSELEVDLVSGNYNDFLRLREYFFKVVAK